MKVPHADRRRDYQKLAAAGSAYFLLARFGARKPTLSTGGDFLTLASILYEAATGKADIDLTHQCRVIVQRRDRKLRDEPGQSLIPILRIGVVNQNRK